MSISQTIIQIGGNLRQALPLLLMVSFALCTPAHGQESRSSEYANHTKEPSRKSIQQISDKIDSLVEQKLSDLSLIHI